MKKLILAVFLVAAAVSLNAQDSTKHKMKKDGMMKSDTSHHKMKGGKMKKDSTK